MTVDRSGGRAGPAGTAVMRIGEDESDSELVAAVSPEEGL
jgi:hypothetical protein